MTSWDGTLRIATRRSPLALWQTHHTVALLRKALPTLDVAIVDIDTSADKRLDVSISEIGGKGAFCKEVQQLVLDGRADLAVHSAKDLQAETPEGLALAAFVERGDPRDALVGSTLEGLPTGATVATGSNRRRVQLAELRPDLEFVELRGNIGTRLGKLDQFDALVMAAVAISRLDLDVPGDGPDVVDVLDPEVMLPQVGQGALAIECRADDRQTLALLGSIDHPQTRTLVSAERDFLIELGGDCDLPAGAHARPASDGAINVVGMLAGDADDPATLRRASVTADPADEPGTTLARRLRAQL